MSGTRWGLGVAAAALAAVALSSPGRNTWLRFLGSLRLKTPPRVNVRIPGSSGPGGRQVQNMIGGMVAESATVTLDEPDRPLPGVAAAERFAGFAPLLPATRTDTVALTGLGARSLAMSVKRAQLATILAEAGLKNDRLPAELEGSRVTITTPRAIQAQYGHCPQAPAATIQGQLQGPPPTSAENGDCIVLTEGPVARVTAPTALDVSQLVGIALELAGMSPNQEEEFRRAFDWRAIVGLSVPRFIRSSQTVRVAGTPGILLGTVGRRGPTWTLIWVKGGMVYSLAGYGSTGDAVPLASALAPRRAR